MAIFRARPRRTRRKAPSAAFSSTYGPSAMRSTDPTVGAFSSCMGHGRRSRKGHLIVRNAANRPLSSLKFDPGMSMSSAWRSICGWKHAGSIASTYSAGSVFSEDLVEADEESELLGVSGPFHDVPKSC